METDNNMETDNKKDYFNIKEFHESITKELDIKRNRVRNLVKHWGEDGKYKEALLKNIIKKFLPSHYLIGSGFVVKPGKNRGEHIATKQIDLIIYNSTLPVLFREEDFVILTPETVYGIIEVKTNIENQDLTQEISKMNEIGEFIYEGLKTFENRDQIFNGIFSFEGYDSIDKSSLESKVKGGYLNVEIDNTINNNEINKFLVNHICLNKHRFIKSWHYNENIELCLYNLNNLAFSYFISNLVLLLSGSYNEIRPDLWFPQDKESFKEHDFSIDYSLVRKTH